MKKLFLACCKEKLIFKFNDIFLYNKLVDIINLV